MNGSELGFPHQLGFLLPIYAISSMRNDLDPSTRDMYHTCTS